MSITVWVAEEILDHEPGWVRGVFSSRELAIDSILSQRRDVEWTIRESDDGIVEAHFGTVDTGRKVRIEPHVIDSPKSA